MISSGTESSVMKVYADPFGLEGEKMKRKISASKSTTLYADPFGLEGEKMKSSTRKSTSRKKRIHHAKFGVFPNLYFRALPLAHLQLHPSYVPLPYPPPALTCVGEVKNYPESSQQWDILHAGRLSTSCLNSALGFLEPSAADILDIPRSLRGSGRGNSALARLSQPALSCADVKVLSEILESYYLPPPPRVKECQKDVWGGRKFRTRTTQFMSNYIASPSLPKKIYDSNPSAVRMKWGGIQEPSALLTVLNYCCDASRNSTLLETGICVGEDLEDGPRKVLVGATPDAILRHEDGTLEAVEVKNHSPFVRNRGSGKEKRRMLGLSDREPDPGFPRRYFAQAQLEMFCVGKECKSCVFYRQTATKGGVMVRVERDDIWLRECFFFSDLFYDRYVVSDCGEGLNNVPPENFFFDDKDEEIKARHRRFVSMTKDGEIKHVATIKHRDIQRCRQDDPLFLDNF